MDVSEIDRMDDDEKPRISALHCLHWVARLRSLGAREAGSLLREHMGE